MLFFRSIILGLYVWNLYNVSIQYLSLSLDQAISLNSQQLPEIFVHDTFCLVFLFCFVLQICRCLLSFPSVTPVCCADTPAMSELKTVVCFSELHKSNILHIMSSFYNTSCCTTCVYVPISKLVNGTYSTL